jgi:hypothetical protein
MNYRTGDQVVYNGKIYFIVGGPVMSTRGNQYELSAVPPIFRVIESEIQPVPRPNR